MRGLSAFTVAVAIALSLAAQAEEAQNANNKNNQTSTATGNASNQKATKTSTSSSSSSSSTTTTSSTSSNADGSSTTSLQTTAQAKPRPWSLRLQTLHEFSKTAVQNQKFEGISVWRPSVYYRLNDRFTLSYTQEFFSIYSPDEATKWQVSDGRLTLSDSNIATLPGDISIDGFIRLYLPTSENNRFLYKRRAQFYGYLGASKSIGKFFLSYSLLAMYYVNSQDFYMAGSSPRPNKDYMIENYIAAGYSFTSKLTATSTVGTIDNIYRSMPQYNVGVRRNTYFYGEVALSYAATKNVSLGAIVYNYTPFESNNHVNLLQDSDLSYIGVVSLRL